MVSLKQKHFVIGLAWRILGNGKRPWIDRLQHVEWSKVSNVQFDLLVQMFHRPYDDVAASFKGTGDYSSLLRTIEGQA